MTTLLPLRLDADVLTLGSPLPEPFDLDILRQHVAVDGTEFDSLLMIYLSAAIEWAEASTHRALVRREHRWALGDFPRDGLGIRLPRGQTQAVLSVVYQTADGPVTLTGPSSDVSPAGSDWREDITSASGGVLTPVYGQDWPSDVDTTAPAPVLITFDAGYTAIPSPLYHAVLFAVSDMFDARGVVDIGAGGRNLGARKALVSPYNLVRWY